MAVPEGYDVTAPAAPERWATPPPGRVVCFSPHPDDEVIGCGGAVHLLLQRLVPERDDGEHPVALAVEVCDLGVAPAQ